MRRFWIGVLAMGLVASTYAELKLPALFSDGMVLQRDQRVPVWGWADPGAEVTVSFGGQTLSTTTDSAGKFMVRLERMKASAESRSLNVVSGKETAVVSDVLVGEVWLCSGQSNMAWPVSKAMDFEKEQAEANYPEIRMFKVALKVSQELEKDCSGSWRICTPENVAAFSAVAYFFGRELYEELEVPIGLINSTWGGTRIESWSPMASLEKFPVAMARKAKMDAEAAIFDVTVSEERYVKQMKEWTPKAKAAKEAGTKAPRRPKKQIDPHQSQNYPANLYQAMIHPLIPYGMRGAIWYQGEANAHSLKEAVFYRDLMENMVVQWREDWNSIFPFYAVQLVNFKAPQNQPVQNEGWVVIRESFMQFAEKVPNTGIVVGIDVGDATDIHPKNKQAIGFRLAQQALVKTYGQDGVAEGPLYQSMKKEKGAIVLTFGSIGSGLAAQDGKGLKTFAIAGADQKFVFAEAKIIGDTVVVSSEEIADPEAVRYAWANNPVGCNLANKEGFPASPFRTDDWPLNR